jgi:hypothetical protein
MNRSDGSEMLVWNEMAMYEGVIGVEGRCVKSMPMLIN